MDRQVIIKTKDEKPITPEQKKPKINDIFIPREQDKLFWCYYIIVNSHSNYDMLFNNTFKEEKDQKIVCIEQLRNHKELLKKYKWKRSAIESDLMFNKTISLSTFFCICAMAKINIAVIRNNCIYSLLESESDNVHLLKESDIGYGYIQCSENASRKLVQFHHIK